MSRTLEQLVVDDLSIPERLELIGILWDSITDTTPHPPVPESHLAEIKRRRAAADADPEGAIPWEEVRARLQGRG